MRIALICLFALLALPTRAQMWNGADTLYGNEWIDYSRTYYKIRVADDGLYRIGAAALAARGLGAVPLADWRLFRDGAQVPIFISAEGAPGPDDYVEFYGQKNRGEVERYLFDDPDADMTNPHYSLFNDTAAYFLVARPELPPLRVSSAINDLSDPPAPEPYCLWTVREIFNAVHTKKRLSAELSYSWYDGAGFARAASHDVSVTLALPKRYAGGPNTQFAVRYVCGLGQHRQQILLDDALQAEDQFTNWRVVERAFEASTASLGASAVVRVRSAIGTSDRHNLAFVSARYPRLLDFDNATQAFFELEEKIGARYLEISGFPHDGAVLYDLAHSLRLVPEAAAGGPQRVRLPDAPGPRILLLSAPAAIAQIGPENLRPTQFRDYRAEDATYLIITHPRFAEAAQGFGDWRAGAAGGGHRVCVADVGELYDQFGYGVRFSPMALRNFCHYVRLHWPEWRYVLLLGKGIEYSAFRTTAQQAALADSLFFIPVIGSPGADQLYVMRGNRLSRPIAAIGRVAASTPKEALDYLDKVKSHEQALDLAPQTFAGRAWSKRVVHNSGGLNTETAIIRNYANSMKSVLENNRFGADVHTFFKTSNDPIQLSAFTQMLDLINDGVALWMIYGHSSAFAVDFDIGTPNDYDNRDRYPFMLILGCFSGQCAAPQQSIGEQFILAPRRGAVAYLASVNYSFIDALHTYGRKYYELLGGEDYGKGLGEILQNSIGFYEKNNSGGLVALLHQNQLQGDPAIRLHPHPGPDYLLDALPAPFAPDPAPLEADSVRLRMAVLNIGEHRPGQLELVVEQRLPDNSLLERLRDTIPAPPFRQELDLALPVAGSQSGFNRFFARIKPLGDLFELPPAAAFNNELADPGGAPGRDLFFFENGISLVWPPDYALVSDTRPTLHASTLNPSAPVQRYLFEMDTLADFSSPWRRGGDLISRGGLLSWTAPTDLESGRVYYWRAARDSLVNGLIPWRQRSFVCLPADPPQRGWNQSHFGQWNEDVLANLEWTDGGRRLRFADNSAFVNVQVAYRGANRYPGFQNGYYEGFYGDFGWNQQGITRGVCVALGDPKTGRFVRNPEDGPNGRKRYFFWFDTRDSLRRRALMDFLEKDIPDGYYVGLLAFNTPTDNAGGYAPNLWAADSLLYGRNLFQTLEAQGAKRVRATAQFASAPHPYGLVFRKNDPLYPARDTLISHPDSLGSVRANYSALWTQGFLETPPTGPARAWRSALWEREPTDAPDERAALQIWGVRAERPDTLLFTLEDSGSLPLDDLDATRFPQLRLRYETFDTTLRTPPQLRLLRLLYEGLPEGAIAPHIRYEVYADTLQRGDSLRVAAAFVNISDLPMDSVLVQLRIEEAGGSYALARRLAPLAPGDTLDARLAAPTLPLGGAQRLTVDFNPAADQPELFHFNNVALRNFYVRRDQRNPLLDVTFDGRYILDGDLVSPKPFIALTLRDDDRFLPLRDSATFSLRLTKPDGTVRIVQASDPDVLFFPAQTDASGKKNLARLEWRPELDQDGDYRLEANGRDASGNLAGPLDYRINFRVIARSALSNILNYPNPFSTRTCFVYTLTGAEAPAHFKIQIMTVSGRVVREISDREFGPLLPGTHLSDYCWDGRDEFGDRLANGVYLYRIVAKKTDGSDFELFENERTDGYFRHGIGKIVKIN